MLVVILSITFIIYQIIKKNLKIFFNSYFIFFFIFWIYLIINSFFSYDSSLSLSRTIPYIRFGILFLAISFFLNDKNFKLNFYRIILIFLTAICIDAIIQFFFGINLLGYPSLHVSRISSFFNEELILGSFLLKMYPLFLASIIFFYKKNLLKNKLIFISLVILLTFSIYISGERTAFYNFLICNFILLFILYKKKFIKYYILILLIFPIMILGANIKNYNVLDRYLDVKNTIFNNTSIFLFSQTHENHFVSAYKIFKSKPVLGYGVKTFKYLCQKTEFHPIGCSTHPHNIVMQFLSELGILGFLFYLFAFLYFLYNLFKLFISKIKNYENINVSNLKIYFLVIIIINLWPFSPSGNFFNNWLSILIFLSVGFLVHYNKNHG